MPRVRADNAVMRRVLLVLMLGVTACGSEDIDRSTPEVPAAPANDLALPVTAPMAVRERLLEDLEEQNRAARERSRDLDALIRQNR